MDEGWDDYFDPEAPWPFTRRARAVVPLALYMLADELRRDLVRVEIGESTIPELGRRGMVVSLMPEFTRRCSPEWWRQLIDGAHRMADQFSIDGVLRPVSVGEQAMLFLALEPVTLHPALAGIEQLDHYAALPEDPFSPYDAILEALGVSDIEFLWDPDFPNAEDPARRSPALNQLGVPDMRADKWHQVAPEVSSAPAGVAEDRWEGPLAPDDVRVANGVVRHVHSADRCAGQPWGCWIHRPLKHPLSHAPIWWSELRWIVARVCEHGQLHPDPQEVGYNRHVLDRDVSRHECDGCCLPLPEWAD